MSQIHVASFDFFNPTHIFFGAGEMERIGALTREHGKKALIVTTRGRVKDLGILGRVQKRLEEAEVGYVVLEGVEPNPRLSTVYRGVELAKANDVDVVLAVGGGSVIDCAKCIAYSIFETKDVWDLFLGKRSSVRGLPVVALSTISGTGSEMNTNCVITNDLVDPPQKYSTHYTHSFPAAAVIDPALYMTVSKWFTACGMADTIAHVMEKYFKDLDTTPVQDRLAEGIVLTVIENDGVLNNPDDIDTRAKLAWAATMALNGLNDAGRAPGDYDGHTIGAEISARFDITHGASLSTVLPALMKQRVSQNPNKYAQFAVRVFGVCAEKKTDAEIGLEGVKALSDLFKSWGLPTTLVEQDVPESCLEEIAAAVVAAPEGKQLENAEVLEVLRCCYK